VGSLGQRSRSPASNVPKPFKVTISKMNFFYIHLCN